MCAMFAWTHQIFRGTKSRKNIIARVTIWSCGSARASPKANGQKFSRMKSNSSPPDGLAKISQSWDTVQEWKAPVLVFGQKSRELLAVYDRDLCSWRTCQMSLLATEADGLEPFSGTWPRWGMMQNGEAFGQTCSEQDSRENECSLWPTIIAGSRLSHTNGRSCLPQSARHLLDGLNLFPEEAECLMGFPIGWTSVAESRAVQMPSSPI